MNVQSKIVECALRLMSVLALVWGMPMQAQAHIGDSMDCTVNTTNLRGYVFEPGEFYKIRLSGVCTAKRLFASGASVNVQFTLTEGPNQGILRIIDTYANTLRYLEETPLGSQVNSCLGGRCARLPPGSTVSYGYDLFITAASKPGRRTITVALGATMVGTPNYAQWIHTAIFSYDVRAPSCSLSSPSTVNMSFGAISPSLIDSSMQFTSVSVNCPSDMRATATLVPSQAIVSAANGVSRTTLAGLNMRAIWTDSANSVDFNSPRQLLLKRGSNSINLGFKPELATGKTAYGDFKSQYTLNINYL